ncbi:sulfotransferase family [Fragilaria crotonensis]|nr:sulfotransferase family [Fragilaria crotonensis]
MFRFLVEASPGCKDGVHYKADLKTFATLARLHDSMSNFVSVLDLSGVVFHESRCGSTLVANALAAMNPAQNRVYSESAPPLAALKTICGETYSHCSLEQAAQILADTVYLMSRTTDPVESRVFFKIQSIGTRNIEVFQHAFPSTPWIFVYRDPVQVMMSQLAMGPRSANCVRPRKFKSDVAADLAHEKGKRIVDLSDEEYCALHLATITEAAVAAMQREPHLGTPVNYVNLPDILYKDIIPNKFGVELSQEEIDNIIRVSSVYSKGTGNRKGEFKDDSKRKEKLATAEVRAASHLFLDESYATLEGGGLAGATAR